MEGWDVRIGLWFFLLLSWWRVAAAPRAAPATPAAKAGEWDLWCVVGAAAAACGPLDVEMGMGLRRKGG